MLTTVKSGVWPFFDPIKAIFSKPQLNTQNRMTFSNPPTQPSRENSILILKASLKVINHDKNDSLYFVFIQYASQFCIYFSTSIAEVNYYFFEVIQKVSELHESFTTGVTQAKMSANVCIHVEKIGKQSKVRPNQNSTESSVAHSW